MEDAPARPSRRSGFLENPRHPIYHASLFAGSRALESRPAKKETPVARRILVIDDDRRCLEIVRHFLMEHGFEVEICWNPREALPLARENVFDAVILDLVIPGMDGYEICQALKNEPKTAGLPILFASAKVQLPDLFFQNFHGRADFLPKPFKRDELVEKIEKLLRPLTTRVAPGRKPKTQEGVR